MVAKKMSLEEFLIKVKQAPYNKTTIDQLTGGITAGTFDGLAEFESISYQESLCQTKTGTVKLNRR